MHSTTQVRPSAPLEPASLPRWASFLLRATRTAWLCVLTGAVAVAQTPAPKAKTINELRTFYQQNCTRCHGQDGSARGADGKKLGGLDFTQAAHDFNTLSGPASEREIRTMIRTIQKGIFFGLTMPGWKDQLSPEDATLLVREVLLKAKPGKTIAPETEISKAM